MRHLGKDVRWENYLKWCFIILSQKLSLCSSNDVSEHFFTTGDPYLTERILRRKQQFAIIQGSYQEYLSGGARIVQVEVPTFRDQKMSLKVSSKH